MAPEPAHDPAPGCPRLVRRPGRAVAWLTVLMTCMALGACDARDPVEEIQAELVHGRALRALELADEALAAAADGPSRRRLVRAKVTALACAGLEERALDLLVETFGADAPAETQRVALRMLDRRPAGSGDLACAALHLAERAEQRWPEEHAAFAQVRVDSGRVTHLESVHGRVVQRSWGYPVDGVCSHSVEFADGFKIVYAVPSD